MTIKHSIIMAIIVFCIGIYTPPTIVSSQSATYYKVLELQNGSATDLAWNANLGLLAILNGSGIWLYTDTLELVDFLPQPLDHKIEQVTWTPDSTILAGTTSQDVFLWDVFSHTQISTINIPDLETGIEKIVWRPDGLAFGQPFYQEGFIIWDRINGNQIFEFSDSASTSSIAWSPDETKLASINAVGGLNVWNADTYAHLAASELHQSVTNDHTLSWSNDNQHLAVGIKNTIYLLNSESGNIHTFYQLPQIYQIDALVWDNERFLTLAHSTLEESPKSTLWVIDSTSGVVLNTLNGHDDYLTELEYLPEQNYFIVKGISFVQIWDAVLGDILHSIDYLSAFNGPLKWSPDSTLIAASDTRIQIWDTVSGLLVMILDAHEPIIEFDWSPDSQYVAALLYSGKARIWEVNTGAVILDLDNHNLRIDSLVWHPNRLQYLLSVDQDNIIQWEFPAGTSTQTTPNIYDTGTIRKIIWSPDGSLIAGRTSSGTTLVLGAETLEIVASINIGHLHSPTTWYPNSQEILVSSGTQGIYLVNVMNGVTSKVLDVWGGTLDLSPNGRYLLLGNSIGAFIYDMYSYEQIQVVSESLTSQVAWNPSGTGFAVADPINGLSIWSEAIPPNQPNLIYPSGRIPDGSPEYVWEDTVGLEFHIVVKEGGLSSITAH